MHPYELRREDKSGRHGRTQENEEHNIPDRIPTPQSIRDLLSQSFDASKTAVISRRKEVFMTDLIGESKT